MGSKTRDIFTLWYRSGDSVRLLTAEPVFPEEDSEHLEDGLTDEDRRFCASCRLWRRFGRQCLLILIVLRARVWAVFFHTCWEIIAEDVFGAVTEFFRGEKMPKGFTATTISLIPKTASPLAGVNTGRLAYSGFVPGRLLSDNVLLAQELIHFLESRWPDANVVFKLDMAKAYDRVSWEFLYQILQRKGFPQRWIGLVANAISNCWFSVLVNGEHAGFFHSTLGLRQGDPLSPALFVLAADYLSRGLERLFAAQSTMFCHAPGLIRVSHLAYADDLMIFTTTCRQNMELLHDFMWAYERVSGQLINGSKSSFIVGRQTSSLQTQTVQDVLGYQFKHLPITYLGVPLYKGTERHVCLTHHLPAARFAPGLGNDESLPWREVGLDSKCVQATPLHLLQVIHPPKSVLITIERIFNGFFWGSYNGHKHIHWSSWAKACFPVAEGGLGVHSLADYVRDFSMKLWWRFRGKSSLWSEHLHGRYCRNLHPTIVPYNRNHSSVWHRLCRIRDVAEPFIFWTLGEGSVSFWHDNWFGQKPLAQLVHRDTYTMESVRYYLHEGDWNVPRILQIIPMPFAQTICQIPIAAGQGDRIVWTESSTGHFSTKSAWEAIRQASPRRQLLADVWHSSLRPTISVFLISKTK
ncbi:hypothetical protein Sango_2907200 [Sesamum angolense]|uniref:Reverse transcriptase domain-containing protein n=1 Tax=Sesamum angolense TaxID=2727404 RepID=A0AAE1T5Y9_9LAMI|nr:hypothetical protein Sango_2907200 [Sesamum angolense]